MLKRCNCCRIQWKDASTFIRDPYIRYVGMQIYPDRPKFPCVYFFNHVSCGTTLILNIHKFGALIREPIPELVMAGEKECPRHCADVKDFLECENECHNAPFRRLAIKVLSKIRNQSTIN